MTTTYKVAIVGASTLAGKELSEALGESLLGESLFSAEPPDGAADQRASHFTTFTDLHITL